MKENKGVASRLDPKVVSNPLCHIFEEVIFHVISKIVVFLRDTGNWVVYEWALAAC